MPPKDLTPRDGNKIPKRENVSAEEREVMDEIEKLSQDQAHAVAVLAKASAETAEHTDETAMLLSEVKDLLIKVMQHFSIPLPKAIAKEIADGIYDPDACEEDEDDDDEGETA